MYRNSKQKGMICVVVFVLMLLFLTSSRACTGSNSRAGKCCSSEQSTPGIAGRGAELASTGCDTSTLPEELAENSPVTQSTIHILLINFFHVNIYNYISSLTGIDQDNTEEDDGTEIHFVEVTSSLSLRAPF